MARLANTLLLAGVFSLFCMTGVVQAQSGPNPTPQLEKLNSVNLPQMVESAGFQVQEMKLPNGKPYWKARGQVNGWTHVLEVCPYFNGPDQINGFWLKSDLPSPVPANGISAATLLNLLESNHKMAPFFFSYNAATGKLGLNWEYPYYNGTSQGIQKELFSFCKKVRETYPLWSGTGEPPPITDPLSSDPIISPKVPSVQGTNWSGKENVNGPSSPVTFKFLPGGQAIVTTTLGEKTGTWIQNGNQLKIQLPGVSTTYQGTISDTAISGTGSDAIGPWNFSVTKEN